MARRRNRLTGVKSAETDDDAAALTRQRTRPGTAGSGVATSAPIAGPVTHYHARRFEELGDLVLAVTRVLDPVSITPDPPERRALRAFVFTYGLSRRVAGAIGTNSSATPRPASRINSGETPSRSAFST